MNKLDLAPIRERLETLKRTQNFQAEASDPLWEHPQSPQLPLQQSPGAPVSHSQQAAMVEALQQRSQQAEVPPSHENPDSESPALPPEVNLHWQRLQQEAITINE
ncbi:MAG: hypothetical protein AAFY20_15565, partial [Cyanobacteria bacterium J06639_14]